MPVLIEPRPVVRYRPTRLTPTPWARPTRPASPTPDPRRIDTPTRSLRRWHRDHEILSGSKLHAALLRW